MERKLLPAFALRTSLLVAHVTCLLAVSASLRDSAAGGVSDGDVVGGGDGNVTVAASKQDVKLLVNHSAPVVFTVRDLAPERRRLRLEFNSTEPGVLADVRPKVFPGPEGSVRVVLDALGAGKTVLCADAREVEDGGGAAPSHNHRATSDAFVRVSVLHSTALDVLAEIVGWLYFASWSVSFYPQIYENWKRKSVIGLNFDFLSLNIVGFFLYSLFNIGLLWIKPIQDDYFAEHPYGVNPVRLNDVIFSVHAVLACGFTIFQCVIYERGNQSVSRLCKVMHILQLSAVFVVLVLAASSVATWLDFLYACSYVKLIITLVKYLPQAVMNYRRKSTMGWSIGNVLLDFTGGVLSIAQMFILAYNSDDWSSIFGDPTKFGLGFFSVCFDVFFMVQHYVVYKNTVPHEELLNDLGSGGSDTSEDPADNLSQLSQSSQQ